MTATYKVTAGNSYYWQTLRVEAASQEAAAEAFRAYLAGPENQKAEDEEYQMYVAEAESYNASRDADHEEPADEVTREKYAYDFDDDQVEEDDGTWPHHAKPATAAVELMESGGNG